MNTQTYNFDLTGDDMKSLSSMDKTTKRMFKTYNNPQSNYSDTGQVFNNTKTMYKKNTRVTDNMIIDSVLGGN